MNSQEGRPAGRRARGFTLIELLVAVAILGILGTIAIKEVWDRITDAEVTATKTKLQQIHDIVADFKRKHHNLPGELTELLEPDQRNYNKPWIKNEDMLYDAWDNLLILRQMERKGEFEIISLGADGMENGFDPDLGEDSDLSSMRSNIDRSR